ncbi:MAG: protein translocase subunit SecD [Candidatus Omnitrophota bacterium]|nr:MAG: protein translocase subunit SecD [Candidatus Omnitrophota bacterium]
MIKNLKWKALLVVCVVGWAFWMAYPPQEKVKLGLDLKGGMHLILKVDIEKVPQEVRADATDRAIEIIRNRIDQFGVSEPLIQKQGRDHIVVQLPGVTDRDRALQIIKQTAHLEFKLVNEEEGKLTAALDGNVPAGYELKYLDKRPLLLEKDASLMGDSLVDARVEWGSMEINPYVSFSLNSKGARTFSRLTKNNIGKRLAIVLDGKVKSAPVIQSQIPGGKGQITGRFSEDEAADLSLVLRTGALPAPIQVEEERTVGAALGEDSIRKGIESIIVGAVLVLVFMGGYYLWAGLIANFALCLNLVIILGVLSYPRLGAALTLPGIAGIVLTIGMAVDANVLIFERIREELKLGKSLRLAISNGYQKAFLTILDANVTTLIAAFILFQFGTGPVKGFATTLSIGILASMFTALVVGRVIFDILSLGKVLKSLPMLQFIRGPHFNVIGKRKAAYVISIVLIIVGLISLGTRGKENLGIDFSGGSLQEFRFEKPISTDEARTALKEIDLGDSPIQQYKDKRNILIRTYADAENKIIDKFKSAFAGNPFEILRIEKVGPSVGKDLTKRAIRALIFALIGICIYISFRFEFRFAIAAIAALFHDVLIAAGALSFTGREFSLPVIAALLTVVGYSINDTIVVFDRIREDMRLMRKASYEEIINASINQTLSRTLLTSLTTLLVVLALFFLGGAVINDFAFVLLVGIIVGTYSSIFVASPILVDWHRKR